jgi:hypothetical protein
LIVCGRFGISHPRQVLEEWTQEQVTEAHRALDFQLELESPPDEE